MRPDRRTLAGLTALHGFTTWATVLTTLTRVLGQRGGTTRRCPEPGCGFSVTYRDVSAAEARGWQELAAGHPHNYRA